ncbi:spindle and centriole-associated protein 1 [Antennarius striatus]|uniref:spindle and centriole-associated protein 1 n=1 Tax=Antennarius striatus TaxID=241820 RepID=UPI0035B2150E
MSFVRTGRQQHVKGKRPVRTKRTAPKREWVSTVTDLSVHKLTPAELNHRHEIHKSHNKAAAQWELREKALQRRFGDHASPAPLDQASLSIIREVFSDKLLLQDVLARSDRAMAVVKDLFGDAPRRQTGHPSVTMAPNCNWDSALPVHQKPNPPTRLSLLSQSMMDQQALNEVEAFEEDYSDEDASPTCSSGYLVKSTNLRKMKARSRSTRQQYHPRLDHTNKDDPVSGRAPDQTALNATLYVQNVRPKQNKSDQGEEEQSVSVSQVLNPEVPPYQPGKIKSCTNKTRKCISQNSELDCSSSASLSGDQSSLGLLQTMLCQVEADLDALSCDTVSASAESQKVNGKQGLTGFSVALISTLGRLVHLLKQREEEAHREAQERRRLEEVVREQRGLIDALTAEMMTLREEAAALQVGLQQQTAELEQKLDTVVLVMGGLGPPEAHNHQHKDSGVKTAVCQTPPLAERDSKLASISPAVLLSSPRQRNNLQSPVTHPVESHQEIRPSDIMHSYRTMQGHSSSSSLTSLPLTSLPSTSSLSVTSGPISAQLSPEAILAEIAQLSQQNNLIKAQLSRAKGPGSEVIGSPVGSNEQSSLSSGSAGIASPQRAEEKRTSVSSGAEKSEAEREQLPKQAPSPNPLSLSSVEQRLLELNRQSAAARGRLLELIEQQKQSVSARVCPSDALIPPSAFSPQPAGGSPESSMMIGEREVLSQTGVAVKRDAGSETSSHSVERVTVDGNKQTERRSGREGWFALSTHVR